MSPTWRRTCSATGSCSPTTRSATASSPTTCSGGSWRPWEGTCGAAAGPLSRSSCRRERRRLAQRARFPGSNRPGGDSPGRGHAVSAAFVDPPGRQGPGAMSAALVEQLDLVLAQRAAGVLPGDRRAHGRGVGTELAQIRAYQAGDDVRRLDAAASARTGVPHVRDHVPERTLTTWVVLDVSASMAFGTADRLKSDVAEGVALVVGRLAVRRAGRVALITCGGPAETLLPPRGGRPALIAMRNGLQGVAPDGESQGGALAGALRRVALLARGPGLVVLISDFREGEGERPEWNRALAALSARHDLLAVEVVDRREAALPDVGEITLVDPETGKRIEADTSSPELRRRFEAAELARRDDLKRQLRRARAAHVELDTDSDWLRALGRNLR